MVRFLDDGRIEIDSNTVECSMRPGPSTERTCSLPTATKAAPIGRCISILHRQIV
ncbi:MAG: hypothetical protein JO358_15650 [Alphaproteobacteria bacterium]|nr:hypothetical protein [Alphaproteobacteria bacterium]